jgi:hypothetical protein
MAAFSLLYRPAKTTIVSMLVATVVCSLPRSSGHMVWPALQSCVFTFWRTRPYADPGQAPMPSHA